MRRGIVRRGFVLVFCVGCLTPSGCGSAATNDRALQAAAATAIALGAAALDAAAQEAAARDAAKHSAQQLRTSKSSQSTWRLIRQSPGESSCDDSDSCDDDTVSADAETSQSETSTADIPELSLGSCIVCE
jgi:hypothetical protein